MEDLNVHLDAPLVWCQAVEQQAATFHTSSALGKGTQERETTSISLAPHTGTTAVAHHQSKVGIAPFPWRNISDSALRRTGAREGMGERAKGQGNLC